MAGLIEERLLRIRITYNNGDKMQIKLPINFVKKIINNNTFEILNYSNEFIDNKKIQDILSKAFEYELTGEIANIERKNGDTVRLIISWKFIKIDTK